MWISVFLLAAALSLGGAQADTAVAAYEVKIRASPYDATLYAELASLLIANRAPAEALAWIQKGLAAVPSDAGLRLRHGIALHALAKPEESLKVLEALPASGESRLYVGLDYRALGNHAAAQKHLSAAWDLGLRDPYALYSLIEEDHALADKTAGLQHFKLFLAHFPGSPWLHVLYANAYLQKGNDVEARREYQEALRMKPDLPAVNFRLGLLLYKDGEYVPAAECFRKELALSPSYADANLFLGQTLRNLGQQEEAIPYLKRTIELDSRSELGYRALVATLGEKGDLNGAVEILRMAENEFPANASFPAQRASLLTRLNRGAEALKEQEKFRALRQAGRNQKKAVEKTP